MGASACWTPKKSKPGVKGFDKYYISYEEKQVVERIGEGDSDFVVRTKLIEHKEDIKALINSQADQVGINNLIKRVLMTGDTSLIPAVNVDKEAKIVDVTNTPTTLLDAHLVAKESVAYYDSLPDGLKKGRTYAEFMSSITSEEFNQFLATLAPKKEGDK